jgi:hypothetical protein
MSGLFVLPVSLLSKKPHLQNPQQKQASRVILAYYLDPA